VFRTGRPARIDEFGDSTGAAAELAREMGTRASVGVPITIEGRLWGVMSIGSTRGPPPGSTEDRLAGFIELVGTAIANAEAHAALTASRARIMAVTDQARRHVERGLHHGVQQRLASLALELRQARAAVPSGAGDLEGRLESVVSEVTGLLEQVGEIARGLHAAALAEAQGPGRGARRVDPPPEPARVGYHRARRATGHHRRHTRLGVRETERTVRALSWRQKSRSSTSTESICTTRALHVDVL
jgi:hypothetical protein